MAPPSDPDGWLSSTRATVSRMPILSPRHLAGVPFPRTFHTTVKSIVRRLFRVYAHLYNHHFAQLCALSIEGEWRLEGRSSQR